MTTHRKQKTSQKQKNQERQLTEAAQMLLRVYLKLVELKFEGIRGDPRGYRAEKLKMNQTWFLKSQAGRKRDPLDADLRPIISREILNNQP